MQLTQLLQTDGFEAAKELVSQSIATSDDIRLRYGWAKPIFEQTTEKYIADALAAEPAKRIYKINPLSENLGIAGQLLETAIARQDAIYDLEISALNAVIEDLVFNETAASQQKIAEANLEAALAQYAHDANSATPADVGKMFDLQHSTNAFRAASRSAKGGALNLAERVAFLREQQAETVRSIYERLMSVALVLPSSGLGRPTPLPPWKADAGLDNLRGLAKWIKDGIKSVERNIANETVVDVVFSTSSTGLHLYDANDGPLSASDLAVRIGQPGYDEFKFDFDRALIASIASLTGNWRFRLLSVGVSFVFDEDFDKVTAAITNGGDITGENAKREILRDWRSRLRLALQILPPRQRGTMADGNASEEWGYPALLLYDSVGAATAPELASMTLVYPDKMLNLNPIGRWYVSMSSTSKTPQNLTGDISDRPFGTKTKMANVTGLIFCFRLAAAAA
jgi:hypothetical protein